MSPPISYLPRFEYPELERITRDDGVRHYVCPNTGQLLPSVTTVLDGTADKSGLLLWEQRVGKAKADSVRKEATAVGGLMHAHLEAYVQGVPRPRGNNVVRVMAERMADTVIKNALPQVSEIWGMEIGLHMPDLYAGTTDLLGIFDGREAIMDYKSTRATLKSREQIHDYFAQGSAYALAHNEVYGTNIKTVVIFMVTRECAYRQYVLEGLEYERHQLSFLSRLERYMEKMAA